MNKDCIFCKIVAKEIPADIVYEDEQFLAFLDINPVRKGHLMIVPKSHFTWIQDLPENLNGRIFSLMREFIPKLINSTRTDYVHIVIEGAEVPHVHLHMIPSLVPEPNAKWNHVTYAEGERAEYAAKIKNAL